MPKPQLTRIPRGDELLTVNQAIELIAYGDLDRARKTQEIHISERAWASRSVLACMDPKVMDALGTLWRMLEEETVEAIERGRPVPASRWAGDRLARLAPGEELALGPFVQELQRVIAHVRIPAAALMAALSEPEPVAPPAASAKVTPVEAVEPVSVIRPTDRAWATAMLKEIRPNGLGEKDRYPVLLAELGRKGRWVGNHTLKRALDDAEMSRRKRRRVSQKLNRS